MPLELKLPLLMSAVLVAVLGVALILTDATLSDVALKTARERLNRATRQLASVGSTGLTSANARYASVANDSAVRRALRQLRMQPAATRELETALSRVVLPIDSGMPVELWSVDGRRIGFIGNDVRNVPLAAHNPPELPRRISTTFDTSSITSIDSIRVGPLYFEDERIHFWLVMAVRDRGQTIGYITHQRRIALSPQTQRTLRDLSGDSVSLYYRNVDGSFWASGTSGQIPSLTVVDSTVGRARDGEGGEILFHEERIGKTPLVVGMHLPARTVLTAPRRTVRRILLASSLLAIVGVIAAWLIGRRVARPLGDLRRAVGSLATGDYAARVPETGDIDIRRLAESFNRMAQEIGTSRAALERQTREAQAANNAKSEFLTTMSHELRTPLNAIGGYADLMGMELRGPLTDTQRRDLQRIKASQEHLLGLISGVLDLSRIEAGRVTYDMVDIAVDPFLAGMDELVAPQAAAKQVTLSHEPGEPDVAVIADREKLRQVLLNLLSNAIRHTPPDGRITLSARRAGVDVEIAVEDTGPGIPVDKRDVVFEPFVQLDRSLAKTREGIGLGLAISRDLARGMSGDLVAHPGREGGARFVLTLPRGDGVAAKAHLSRTDEARIAASGIPTPLRSRPAS
jgi:signal transduction histidine kinase